MHVHARALLHSFHSFACDAPPGARSLLALWITPTGPFLGFYMKKMKVLQ